MPSFDKTLDNFAGCGSAARAKADVLEIGKMTLDAQEEAAALKQLLIELVCWIELTGVEKNPALAGCQTITLTAARDVIGGGKVPVPPRIAEAFNKAREQLALIYSPT